MESLEEFYQKKFDIVPSDIRAGIGEFNIFRIQDRLKQERKAPRHVRRNFYKAMLYVGNNVFYYGDQVIRVSGRTLLFFSPSIPYSYENVKEDTTGYFCVFKDEFYKENFRIALHELPLFATGSVPVFQLNEDEYKAADAIFSNMFEEIDSGYLYKYDLIRSYLSQLIFQTLKMTTQNLTLQQPDSGTRITAQFLDLLEKQFLIEFSTEKITLRSPGSFAGKMAVHVNYLNRIIKRTTGKTTSEHINERITAEAKIMLRHSTFNIAEIAYSLGFDEPLSFNKFFKKHMGLNPSSYRKV